MSDYATKDDVQEIVNTAVTKAVDDLSQIIQSFAQSVDERFNKVEADIAELNVKYDHLITTLDTFLKRLDDMEVNNLARDAQLARLERWIEQVAAKTGVKLEY
jgi:septal ring factor EnvC (AmiA/AmiB activator)